MKALMTICGLLFLSFGFAQEVKPTAEEIAPDTYRVKYYHDNGKVMHEGNYVDGKSNGLWKMKQIIELNKYPPKSLLISMENENIVI